MIVDVYDIEPDILTSEASELVHALIHKTVNHWCVVILVIATQEETFVRVPNFVGQEKANSLYALNASITIITLALLVVVIA